MLSFVRILYFEAVASQTALFTPSVAAAATILPDRRAAHEEARFVLTDPLDNDVAHRGRFHRSEERLKGGVELKVKAAIRPRDANDSAAVGNVKELRLLPAWGAAREDRPLMSIGN